MDNGTPTLAPAAAAPIRPRPTARKPHLLYKMIGVAIAIHLVLILATSTSLFGGEDPNSPEQLFEKAESAMDAGHYLEAMDLYQQVLDKQPKLAPVFARAGEQHQAAERLAKQQAAKLTATKPTADNPAAPSQTQTKPDAATPANPQLPASKPDFDVPPELRPK